MEQWFTAYQDQFCVWFSSRSTADCPSEFFSSEWFSEKRNGFILLLPVRVCFLYQFNASIILVLYLSFAQSCKMFLTFLKLSAILKRRGENFVMMTSIVHLSSKGWFTPATEAMEAES